MKTLQNTDERDLLLRLRDGDHAAFDMLYGRYKHRLAANFIRLLRADELAQDALQDLFMKIWDSRAMIDPEQSFRAYLFRISENLVIDYYRRAARNSTMQAQLLADNDGCYTHIEESLISQEHIALVQGIISKLPEQQRKAYTLHKIEGKSYKEISELMNISASTINKHIHYAHRFVKQQMDTSPYLSATLFASALMAGI